MVESVDRFINSNGKKYLFGAGQQAINCLYIFKCIGMCIDGIIVTHKDKESLKGIPLYGIDELKDKISVHILLAVSPSIQEKIKQELESREYVNIYPVDDWEVANIYLKERFYKEYIMQHQITSVRDKVQFGSKQIYRPEINEKYARNFIGTDFTDIILPEMCGEYNYVSAGTYIRKECLTDNKKVIWDIGAGTGSFAIAISDKCSMVYAIEASDIAYTFLEKNAGLYNNIKPVNLIAASICKEDGDFYERDDYFKYSSTVRQDAPFYRHIKKKQVTIDYLAKKFRADTGLIKINTGGTEYDVLAGAVSTIKEYHPKIVLSTERNEQISEIKSLITKISERYTIQTYLNRMYIF